MFFVFFFFFLVLLKNFFQRFVLLGWSMGGMIAQAVALAVPKRVAGLVLLSSMWSAFPETMPEVDLAKVFASAPSLGKEKVVIMLVEANLSDEEVRQNPELVKRLAVVVQSSKRPGREIMKQMTAFTECAGVRPVENMPCCELENFALPSFNLFPVVIHGDKDKIIHVNEGRRLAKIWNAELGKKFFISIFRSLICFFLLGILRLLVLDMLHFGQKLGLVRE